MLESSDEVQVRLTREACERFAQRMQEASSSGASNAIVRDHRYTLDRINKLTNEELLSRAIDPVEVAKSVIANLEQRLHAALKAAWQYVNIPFASRSARNEVGKYAESDDVSGQHMDMLFALQTAWTFVHDSGDDALVDEMRQLLDTRTLWRKLPLAA
jgi:hypothetical protein